MEAKKPLRPDWPRIRVTSAGLGFPAPTPASARDGIRRAQLTVIVDGAAFATRTVSA